jgi:hypothetical protein
MVRFIEIAVENIVQLVKRMALITKAVFCHPFKSTTIDFEKWTITVNDEDK